MPTYEYRCPSCGRTEEVLQSMGDTLEYCPTRGCDAHPRRIWNANINRANIRAVPHGA